jgi:hypothetical protein
LISLPIIRSSRSFWLWFTFSIEKLSFLLTFSLLWEFIYLSFSSSLCLQVFIFLPLSGSLIFFSLCCF